MQVALYLVAISKATERAAHTSQSAEMRSKDKRPSFNFVISFLNSSGEDSNKCAEENKNHPECCHPEKSCLNITVYFLPFIFLPIGLDQNRFIAGSLPLAPREVLLALVMLHSHSPAQCTFPRACVPLINSRQQPSRGVCVNQTRCPWMPHTLSRIQADSKRRMCGS